MERIHRCLIEKIAGKQGMANRQSSGKQMPDEKAEPFLRFMTTNRRDKGNFRKRHHDFSPEGDRDPGVFLPCFNLQ